MLSRFVKNITKIVLFVIVFYSCTSKDIYYDLPTASNKLVVYCLFNPDSTWKASVSKLGNLLDLASDTSLWITNSTVILFEENAVIDTFIKSKNNEYISSKQLKPEFRKEYKLKILSPGFDEAETNIQTLPEPVLLDSINYLNSLPPDIFPNEVYILCDNQQIDFHSIALKIENSYNGQFFKIFVSDNNQTNREGINLSINSKKDFIEYYSWNCSILEAINTDAQLQIPFDPELYDYLNIYTISESYMLYELSYAEYDFVINTTYFLTPNNIYSNINGGIGIFAGYTSNKIDLREFN